MILSGKEIEKRMYKDIFISDFSKSRLNPNSYNLRLDDKLIMYKHTVLDMAKNNEYEEITIPYEGFYIYPGRTYLAKTVEYTETKNLVPMIEGRSSIGRLGMFIHVTAGFGDVGFKGYWTLEISCVQPIKIYPYVEICQIYFHTIEGEYDCYSESGKYQNNNGIQTSRLYREFEMGVYGSRKPNNRG